jgi:hypothetical protein
MLKNRQSKSRPTPRPGAWFIRIRGSYLPVSVPGALTYIPFIAYLVLSLIIALRDSSSRVLMIFIIIPNWIAAGAVMTWFAARKS